MQGETPLERARRQVGALAQPFLLVDYGLRFDDLVRRSLPLGLRLRTAEAADASRLCRLPGGADAAARLAHGHAALLAELEDDLAGCLWYARRPLRAPGFGFPLRPLAGECYAYGLRVAHCARRRGVAAALFAALASHASAGGLQGLGGLVSIHNRAAGRVQRAIGARPRGLLLGLSVRRRYGLVLGRWRLGERPAPTPSYAGDAVAAGSARRSGW